MGNRMVVSVDEFASAVHRIVEENVDDNMKSLAQNTTKAARKARDILRKSPGHVHGGKSPRGHGSLALPVGLYDKGWHVYGRSRRREVITRVVANKTIPRMTHLLELGHGAGGRFMTDDGVWHRPTHRTPRDYAIKRAYEASRDIARGDS